MANHTGKRAGVSVTESVDFVSLTESAGFVSLKSQVVSPLVCPNEDQLIDRVPQSSCIPHSLRCFPIGSNAMTYHFVK